MGTTIRPKISEDRPEYISKHRYYELKHFCLQFREWERAHAYLVSGILPSGFSKTHGNWPSDRTGGIASLAAGYSKKLDMVRDSAHEADPELERWILLCVVDGLSYDKLQPPCSKDTFYKRYRLFFAILSRKRD